MARSDRARPGLRKIAPGRRRVSAGQVAGGRGGDREQARFGLLPVVGDDLADGEPQVGVGDRRGEQLVPRPGAEPLAELVPAVDAPGHRPAQRPVDGDRRQPLGAEQVDRRGPRRPAAGIEPDRAARSSRPRRWRTGRRRSRTTSARPRRSRRWPRSPRPRRCRPAGARGSPSRWPAAGWSPPSPAARSRPTASCAAARPAGRAPAPGHAEAPPGSTTPDRPRPSITTIPHPAAGS